jgi:hypothetical protein
MNEAEKLLAQVPPIPKTDVIFVVTIQQKSDNSIDENQKYALNFFGFDTPIKINDFQNFYVNFNNEARTSAHFLSFQGIKAIVKVDSFYDQNQKSVVILSKKKSGAIIGYLVAKNQNNDYILHGVYPAKIFNMINPKSYNPASVLEDILKNKDQYENVLFID